MIYGVLISSQLKELENNYILHYCQDHFFHVCSSTMYFFIFRKSLSKKSRYISILNIFLKYLIFNEITILITICNINKVYFYYFIESFKILKFDRYYLQEIMFTMVLYLFILQKNFP